MELWARGNDAPLITPGRKVRLQFEGWPAVQFAGWPSVAVGTFGGIVGVVDAYRGAEARDATNVTKVLTVYAAIMFPLSLVAGFYGMNFTNLPGLEGDMGWVIVTALMLLIAAGPFPCSSLSAGSGARRSVRRGQHSDAALRKQRGHLSISEAPSTRCQPCRYAASSNAAFSRKTG